MSQTDEPSALKLIQQAVREINKDRGTPVARITTIKDNCLHIQLGNQKESALINVRDTHEDSVRVKVFAPGTVIVDASPSYFYDTSTFIGKLTNLVGTIASPDKVLSILDIEMALNEVKPDLLETIQQHITQLKKERPETAITAKMNSQGKLAVHLGHSTYGMRACISDIENKGNVKIACYPFGTKGWDGQHFVTHSAKLMEGLTAMADTLKSNTVVTTDTFLKYVQ